MLILIYTELLEDDMVEIFTNYTHGKVNQCLFMQGSLIGSLLMLVRRYDVLLLIHPLHLPLEHNIYKASKIGNFAQSNRSF